MGLQGNYKGSGSINQHKELAMRGEISGDSNNQAINMNEGGSSDGLVDATNMPKGSGEPEVSPHRPGDVRAINPSEGY